MEDIVLGFVAFIPQDTQCNIGQRSAYVAAADVVIGNSDNGAVFVCQIMKRYLIIGPKCVAQKFSQFDVVLQQWVGQLAHLYPYLWQRISAV